MSEIKPKPCPFCGSSDVESCPEGERDDGKPWFVYTFTAIIVDVMDRSSIPVATMLPMMQHARHRSTYGTGG